MTVEVYSQRKPVWAGDHYGLPQASSKSTIGSYGCGITAVGQKLTLMGFPTTPPDVQAALLRVDGFRHDLTRNLINWPRVPVAYPQLHFNGRGDYFTGKPTPHRVMQAISERLAIGDQVILYVDASRYERGLQQHFVLAVAELEGGIQIMNPWNGRLQDLRPYGDTDAIAVCGVIWLDTAFDASAAI